MHYEKHKLKKPNSIEELLNSCPKNQTICNSLIKTYSKVNSLKYKKIVCTISGGADSDVMLDIVWKCDRDSKVDYIWFDTGLEYQATKVHLKEIESRYGIKIHRYKAKKPIPVCCKSYGQPFISKYVSEMMYRLIKHNFTWEDKPFDELYQKYPKCKIALSWWTNNHKSDQFNIKKNKYLKEFIIQNHPKFMISNKCCYYAKKRLIHDLIKNNKYDLNIFGIRRAEGGARATAYKSCFDQSDDCDNYRPLFWYTDRDKQDYIKSYGIGHSRCYTDYGLLRTGCAGCPYGRDFEFELKIIKQYEPKLYKAVNHIFGDSYEYTRKYIEFRKQQEKTIRNN